MKKSALILLFLTLLFCSSALALQVTYDSVQEEVLQGQPASYVVHLTNDGPVPTTITILSTDISWILDKDSTSYEVDAGETKDVPISYTPVSTHQQPRAYGINFQATTPQTKETKVLPVLVVDYKDTVSAEFTSLPTIDPRRSTIVKLLLKNKHNIALKDLEVSLQSGFFKQSKTVSLEGKEQKELEFPIALDPDTQEGDYTLNAIVNLGQTNLLSQQFLYKVGRYSNVKEVVEPKEGFLISGQTVTETNEGNYVISGSYKKSFGTLAYTFTTLSPDPNSVVKTDGIYNVEWDYNLDPGKSIIVTYTTNYLTPLLFLVVLVGGLIAFKQLSKKYLEVTKRVLVLHTTQGGLAIMKVVVSVRNPGKTTINHVSVMDKIPSNIKAPTDFGVIKPSNVRNTPEGIKVIWELSSLRAGEEKSLTYKIESKMQLTSKSLLPAALAKFMSGSKKIVASSQAVSLNPKA